MLVPMTRTRPAALLLLASLTLTACGTDPSPSARASEAAEPSASPLSAAPSASATASQPAPAPSVPTSATWTPAAVPETDPAAGGAVVAPGGDGLVAIGFDGAFGSFLWTSPDGAEWRDVTPGGFEGVGIAAVEEVDGGLVGVGRGNTLDIETELAAAYLSQDGLTWRQADGSADMVGQMIDVVATGDGLYAVGGVPGADTAGVWRSSDGETWERVGADIEHAFLWSIAEGGPGLVAVGWRRNPEQPDMAVWTSADGSEWTLSPDPEESAGFEATDVLAHEDGTLVLAGSSLQGEGGRIWFSEDGVDWTVAQVAGMTDGAYARSLVSTPHGLLAVGGGDDMSARAWISGDGRSWVPLGDPVPEAYFNDAFVTDDGTLLVIGATQQGTLETGIEARAMVWVGAVGD